MTRAFPTRRR